MTRSSLVLSALLLPALAAAQSPLKPTANPEVATRIADAAVAKKPDGGGPASANMLAQNTLNSIKKFCDMATREGKLVATCDDSTAAARADNVKSMTPEAWGRLATRIADADATIRGKPRHVVVVNRSELMAEVSSAGVVTLRK